MGHGVGLITQFEDFTGSFSTLSAEK
jgi:hypothetical protein